MNPEISCPREFPDDAGIIQLDLSLQEVDALPIDHRPQDLNAHYPVNEYIQTRV
jgi:hypothetical protein